MRTQVIIGTVFFAALAVMGLFARVAWVILALDVVVSIAAFLAYRSDKKAAREGRWRTQESALHLMSVFGGWPGALVAQQRYRHKTKKRSFRLVFWLTVAGNIGMSLWLIASLGAATAPV